MIKIVTIIGARPQFIKAAAISKVINEQYSKKIKEILVHTGQHYDKNMSQVFFDEMHIPQPSHNLKVGSGSHGTQTAQMITGIEEVLENRQPDCTLLYGDTNSTLAGAVASAKLRIPVVHIEAGMRSFNKSMPEEINRITCDHTSTLMFSPTPAGIDNLKKEGFNLKTEPPFTIDNPGIFHCGDVMYDNSVFFGEIAHKKSTILREYHLIPDNYILATIHRDNNTDNPARLNAIFNAIYKIAKKEDIRFIIPLHPRTSKLITQNLDSEVYSKITRSEWIQIIEPVSFLDMIMLEKNALMIMTDSGGVQKEAYFWKKPCIILRPETEWIEIVKQKTAACADANEKKILRAFNCLKERKNFNFSDIFGDGKAAEFIVEKIYRNFSS